ncbi:hypothetical protein BCR36DRAFT_405601 [Piromyces finnis]|uniref:CRAL-TRIO domain-containing protein n=1 Tax=Piromyces finnis TaxID=1754191 RepID=A0A1Y1V445_9FUNG|nr:hypothetical protein BCR36DRAFT_405601 [Piromyces finnis]|eukprot:ORX46655.1 hypothetical protein BCR36DRAFT_405601 [Piromyces finnis]
MENYKNDVIRLQREVFSYLKNESNLSEKSILKSTTILMDEACIYRFYKKAKYSFADTKEALIDHLTWMLSEDVFNNTFDTFELNTNAYNYLLNGFIYFCGHDKMGRPIGIINLNHYDGNGDIESLKKYMIFMLELAQKLIRDKNLKNPNSIENSFINNKNDSDDWDIQTQFSIILDLDNLKMSTLNYEIFPTLIKIFINHYPFIVETVYILNYRWIHAGLWGMVKQMLSESITRNMLFLKKNEIFDYIDSDQLLVEFGGNNTYKYNCHTCKLYEKFGKKQNSTTIPLHLLPTNNSNIEISKRDEADNEDKWYDAYSSENEMEEITEEIIQKPNEINVPSSISPIVFNNESSMKNETIYPNKESNYLYEDEPVLNISYHPIKLSIKDTTNINTSGQKVVKKTPMTVKYIIYGVIRHILMPFYAYVRRIRCTSVYFELILSRWIKKFSDENNIPPSFNYLSFFITNTTNISRSPGQSNSEANDMVNVSQTTDTSSSSSVTSTTLVSPTAMNYMNDQSTYFGYSSSSSSSSHQSSHQSTLYDKSNNGSLSWEDINSLVQHTLRTCLPEYYNPFKDSIAILFLFASVTLLTHLIYPRNRYRLYFNFWKNLYQFRREIYSWLGLRPNTSKSIIQVI